MLGSAAWRSLKTRLRSALVAARARALAGETSSHDRWWTAALDRLDRARPPVQHEAEEFAAYAIEEVASAPPGIAEMIRALIGRVKAWALRTFGQQWGSVTPQQLKALAVAALRGWALGNRQTARGGASSSRTMASLLPEALTEIDAVAKGKEPDRSITVSMGSEVLGALGVPKGRITLSADVIWKAISDHKTTPAQTKAVLGALDDPAMVFGSRTQKNALVLVSDVQTREGIGVIALHIEPVIGRPEHRIASIHGRRGSQIETSLSEGLLRYIDKEKAAALPLSTGLLLPKELTARRPRQKILQPRDVFKTWPKASITEGIFNSVAPVAVPHPQTIRASLRDRIRAATTQAMPTLLATVPLRPLLTEIARDIPSAREYLRQKQAMDTLRDEWHAT